MGTGEMDRGIPSSTLATLRGILVSSLSRENLGPHDIPLVDHTIRIRTSRKVHFHEGSVFFLFFNHDSSVFFFPIINFTVEIKCLHQDVEKKIELKYHS